MFFSRSTVLATIATILALTGIPAVANQMK